MEELLIHVFLMSALVGGKWSASCPCRFNPPPIERAPPYPLDRWAPDPVCTEWRNENSWPYMNLNFDLSAVQTTVSRYTDWATALPNYKFLLHFKCFTHYTNNYSTRQAFSVCLHWSLPGSGFQKKRKYSLALPCSPAHGQQPIHFLQIIIYKSSYRRC
jgi:hypothetical protein